jgi:hypothetical protein
MTTRLDGSQIYAEGESPKTGSQAKQDRLEAFVEWLLLPEGDREPATKTAFAEEWGVSVRTLQNDLKEPYLQREISARARAVARVDKLPEVLRSLYEIVEGNSLGITAAARVSAARTILDWIDRTTEVREKTMDFRELSDEELMEGVLRILNLNADK